MNENKEGSPTGRLNEDCTQMEVYCYLKDGTEPMVLSKQWIPITEEMKAKIAGQNTGVVSMGSVVSPELQGRLISSDLMLPNDAVAEDVPCAELTAPLVPHAINPDTSLPEDKPDGQPYVMLSSLSEALGEETTQEEEEHWAALRADMADKERARYKEAATDEVPQRRSTDQPENSGFNVNYYSVPIPHPKRPDRAPYIFEVDDLIGALNLTFNEGTILKSLVRSANEREHGMAKLGGDAIRDAQKMVHSSGEHLRILTLRTKK